MEQQFNPYTPPPEGRVPNDFKQNETPPVRQIVKKPNSFEIFAFGFAIASLFTCTIFYIAYVFAGLAILFALLSRGAQMNLSPKAKKSLFLGILGIVLATVIFISTFVYLLNEFGSIEGILREGSEMLGIDFEKEFGNLFQ